jgi:pyruvate kinase
MPTRPRAKIVCTLGPSTSTATAIEALVDAGMDVARLNFSHGTQVEHGARIALVRAASDATQRAVGVLADLQGPRIRLGTFAGGPVTLKEGDKFTLTTERITGDAHRASTTYADFARDVEPGDAVLINDGLVKLEVIETDGVRAVCRVIEGGPISDHKGINLPGAQVRAPALSEKDADDLRFALAAGVDLVALSFVRSPEDVAQARRVMDEVGRRVPLIAKIERPEAVSRLEDIIDAFDGVMVARGDLGIELPLERVPLVQKRAIVYARRRAKPVIVATQMLESMITNSRPTRAEVSDVANAVLDGADAVMLSGETSIGAHPVETVDTMRRIITTSETGVGVGRETHAPTTETAAALADSAARLAVRIDACALVAFTTSGSTARHLASHRAPTPLLAIATDPAVRSQLALVWGVETFVVPPVRSTDEMVVQVDHAMLALGRGQKGERVVIVAGTPPGVPGTTNTIRVHRLGKA